MNEASDIWTNARDVVAAILLFTGLAFTLIGSIGVIRFPDFYTRLHAAGVTDTGGALLILFGLAALAGWSFAALKLLLIGLLLMVTTPVATHLLAQAAHAGGREPLIGRSPVKPKRPKKSGPAAP
ncbi:MAG: monovalent cation/H(+) antiporter subunit G [Caulobacterales bacterium]